MTRIDEEKQGTERGGADPRSLSSIVDAIERAFQAGDFRTTARLLDADPLAAWYGLSPDRLRQMIEEIDRAGQSSSLFLRLVGTMLARGDVASLDVNQLIAELGGSAEVPSAEVLFVGEVFSLRLKGRPREALRKTRELDQRSRGALQPLFDLQRGWGLFTAVQTGVTAMLAGDFPEALARFTGARLHVQLPHLSFLVRDALTKSAMIEALYGDGDVACALLDEAEHIPRTTSWAEGLIDTAVVIATALARVSDPAEGVRLLQAAPLHEVSEMWPFYIAALHRQLRAAGNLPEARRQIEMFASLPLPRIEREGFTGSVLPLARAWDAVYRGDLTDAREALSEADPDLAITKVITARLKLAAGKPREALKCVEGIGKEVEGLRTVELHRLAIIATAHRALGLPDDAAEVLQLILTLPGGISPADADLFPPEIHHFAHENVVGWPFDPQDMLGPAALAHAEVLTPRELDILRELATDHDRDMIAAAQFISLNTLKAHLRSIYRKLGVRSRAAAVLEAERRGLI